MFRRALSSGRQRDSELRDELFRSGELARRSEFPARIGPVQIGRLLAANLPSCAKSLQRVRQAAASRARPWSAQDRALQRRDGVVLIAQASRSSGCLSKRKQRHRRDARRARPRPRAGRKFRPAYRRAHRRRNPPPRYSSAAAPRARGAPSARSGVTSAAVFCRPAPLRAARPRWRALLPRDWRLRSASAWRARCRRAPRIPDRRIFAATNRSRRRAGALPKPAVRARAAPPEPHCVAGDADACEQSMHGELRMARRRRDVLSPRRPRSAATMRRRDRYRAPAAPRRHAADARWWR